MADELEGSIAIACDVADEAAVQGAVAAVVARPGPDRRRAQLSGTRPLAPIDELTLTEWNRMLAVHLTGTFLVCKPRFRRFAPPEGARS